MKIGIGISTTPKRTLDLQRYRVPAYAELYVHNDTKMHGIAEAKNAVFSTLYNRDCTHIITFDDDCYPTREGWCEYLLAHDDCPYYTLPDLFGASVQHTSGEYQEWTGGLGCFGFQTRELLESVGGYNTAYHRYGFEDSGRLARIRKRLGLGGFPTLFRIPFYIHSEDVFHEDPTPNMSREEKSRFIDLNRPTYLQEISSDQLYYAFD